MSNQNTIIIILTVLLIASVITCNRCCNPNPPEWEVRTDTVYVYVKDSTKWYKPEVVVITKPERVDSFIAYEKIYVTDTVEILNDYYSKVYYSDTTKTKYGSVVIQDTVTQNRIAARRVFTDFKIPEITITKYPKPTRWSIGPQVGYGFTYNKPSPYIGVGIQYSLFKF
jgi:hypothetical protein